MGYYMEGDELLVSNLILVWGSKIKELG